MSKRSSPLQAIRFIAAVLIFLHHWPFFDPGLYQTVINSRIFAYFFSPVTFFFILSGWSLTSTYYEKIKNHKFKLITYIKKRILKLYPIHILTFFLIIPLTFGRPPLQVAIANLLLIHAFNSSPLYIFSYNAVSWCLSIFLFWYAVFPIVMKFFTLIDRFVQQFAFIFVLLLLGGLGMWIYFNTFPSDTTPYILYYSPFERLIDCLIGVFLFFILKQIKNTEKINRVAWTLIEVGAIGLIVGAHWFAPIIPNKFIWDLYFILPWSVIIGVFALSRGFVAALLSLKPFVLLGSISLEFFLIHPLALRWVYFFIGQKYKLTTLEVGIFSFFVSFWGSVIAAFLFSYVFRLPLLKINRQKT